MLIKKKYWIKLLTFSNLLISSSFLYGAVVDTEEAVSVAKKLTNPVADLVAVPIQYNFNRGMGSNDAGSGQSVVIEPVYPVNLSGGDNLTLGKGINSPWGELLGAERTFPNAFNIEYQTAPGNGGVIGNHQGWRLDNMNQWMGSLKQAKKTSDFLNSDEGKDVIKGLSKL